MSKQLPPVTHVIFDVGNVIVRATHQITYAILDDLGVRPDKRPFFFHNPAYGKFARGQITGEEFAQEVSRLLEVDLTVDQIRRAHDHHMYGLDHRVMKILDNLVANGMPLAFATTTNEWQTEREKELTVRDYELDELELYGPVARSHIMGVTKTDLGAWPKILNVLGIQQTEAGSTLFVDDATMNCQAAEAAGIQVLQFLNANQLHKELNGIQSRR